MPAPASLHPLDALRQVRDMLLERTDPASAKVERAIYRMLHEGIDFESALGLASTWRSVARTRRRDEALRRLAAEYFPTLSGRPRARAMAAVYRAYAEHRLSADLIAEHPPAGEPGLLFEIATNGGMPGEESLRKKHWVGR